MSQEQLNRFKAQGRVGHGSMRCGHMNRDILRYWRRDYGDEPMPLYHLTHYYPTPVLVRQSAVDDLEEVAHRQQQRRMRILVLPKIRMQHVFIDLLTLAELKEQMT